MYRFRAFLVLASLFAASASCDVLTTENDTLSAPGVDPLAKVQGWRDRSWHGDPHLNAVSEIAPDRTTAELAWHEDVPDTLSAGGEFGPGIYGDLDEIDFDEQAIVVWSSGESGSCPNWIGDVRTAQGGAVEVEEEPQSPELPSDPDLVVCTDDWNPYRIVLAVDRDRLPDLRTLPSEDIVGVPDGIITVYPYEPPEVEY